MLKIKNLTWICHKCGSCQNEVDINHELPTDPRIIDNRTELKLECGDCGRTFALTISYGGQYMELKH